MFLYMLSYSIDFGVVFILIFCWLRGFIWVVIEFVLVYGIMLCFKIMIVYIRIELVDKMVD